MLICFSTSADPITTVGIRVRSLMPLKHEPIFVPFRVTKMEPSRKSTPNPTVSPFPQITEPLFFCFFFLAAVCKRRISHNRVAVGVDLSVGSAPAKTVVCGARLKKREFFMRWKKKASPTIFPVRKKPRGARPIYTTPFPLVSTVISKYAI